MQLLDVGDRNRMHIQIDVYKSSGKWYTGHDVYHDTNMQIYEQAFIRFVFDNLPAHFDGGFVVVTDCEDGIGFHNSLYRYEYLLEHQEAE